MPPARLRKKKQSWPQLGGSLRWMAKKLWNFGGADAALRHKGARESLQVEINPPSEASGLLHPGQIAELAGRDFKKRLHAGPLGRLQPGFRLDCAGNPLRQRLAGGKR